MDELMNLREVCSLLNVSRRAVQGYEKAGLVKPVAKNKYGHLLYDKAAVECIGKVKQFQNFGFHIKEIQALQNVSNDVLKQALQEKIIDLENKSGELDEIIRDANELVKQLETNMN